MPELAGRRLPDCTFGEDCPHWSDVALGDYFLVRRGQLRELYFRDPAGNVGRVSKHTITEEADGTISVKPSIADDGSAGTWHGFLTHGRWTW